MAGNRALKSGFAAEAHNKIKSKYDPQLAFELLEWIKDLTNEDIDTDGDSKNFHAILCDGKILCKLINILQPGTIPEKKINDSKLAFKKMENINHFLEGAQKLGVPSEEIFQTVDLWEQQNLTAVCICLQSLARKAHKYGHKSLGPKEAEPNIRTFSEEQLKAGEGVIGLQYGTNKGATASGIVFGNTRHM